MRIVASLVLGLCFLATPAAAQGFKQTVGGWTVSGTNGDCVAGIPAGGGAMLMFVAPASGGENQGAVVLINKNWGLQDGETSIELKGSGPWAGTRRAQTLGQLSAYWMTFNAASDADKFPDSFTVDAYEGARQVANFAVSGVKPAIALMRQCVQATIRR